MRVVLKYYSQDGKIHIDLTWRNASLDVFIHLCRNITSKLLDEVKLRAIRQDDPIALIPVTLVETPLQLIQGAVYYKIYSSRITRTRNKGLLLASMSLGIKQLNELVDKLGSEVEKGVDYYLVSVDTEPVVTNSCNPADLSGVEDKSLRTLVKNTQFIISMI